MRIHNRIGRKACAHRPDFNAHARLIHTHKTAVHSPPAYEQTRLRDLGARSGRPSWAVHVWTPRRETRRQRGAYRRAGHVLQIKATLLTECGGSGYTTAA